MKQIIVRPLGANLTRDTQVIGKMDPYCVCVLGPEKKQTQYKNQAGKNPKWEDQLVFLNTAGVNIMQVQVWDKDVTTSDLVGQGQIDLSPVMFGNGQPKNETVELFYKNKRSGQVYLSITVQFIGGNQGNFGQKPPGFGGNNGGRGGW